MRGVAMGSTTCDFFDPVSCIKAAVGGTSSTATNAAWNAICQSFVDAASAMFQAFGTWFAKAPGLDRKSVV